ncbi:unnamed protein product [Cyclocybe aegerita]|uniref:Uncharacterized protein n=1 Tax=Cyclocybe aegerita TaxID=1973307 RepID=A0A8S0WE97_CYCAE|nr:unnamed protein product [Cyclocybe aegerita]
MLSTAPRARPHCRTCGEPMLGHKRGLCHPPTRESSSLSEDSDETNSTSRHTRSTRSRFSSFGTTPLPSPSPTPSGDGGECEHEEPPQTPRKPQPLMRSPPRYPFDPLVPDKWVVPARGNVRRVNPYLKDNFLLVNKGKGRGVSEDGGEEEEYQEDSDKENANSTGTLSRHASWTPTEIVDTATQWLNRLTPPKSPSPAPTIRANAYRQEQRNATAGPSGTRNRHANHNANPPTTDVAQDTPTTTSRVSTALSRLPVHIEGIIRAAGRYQTRVIAFLPPFATPSTSAPTHVTARLVTSLEEFNCTIAQAEDIAFGMVLIADGRTSWGTARMFRWLWDWMTKGLAFVFVFALLVWYNFYM